MAKKKSFKMKPYLVKFELPHGTFHGIYSSEQFWLDENNKKRYPPKGMVLIEGALNGKLRILPEKDMIQIPLKFGRDYKDMDEHHQYLEEEGKKAEEIDSKVEGVQVGALFTLPVGDGSAWYVVTKVFKKNCEVEWRGFGPDRYVDHHFGYGGRFSIEEVGRHVGWRKGLKELFGKKEAKSG